MRTVLLFCIICVISTGALPADIRMKNSWFGIPIAAGTWLIFMLYLKSKRRNYNFKKEREQMFRHNFQQHLTEAIHFRSLDREN